jgi:hypothetical protein
VLNDLFKLDGLDVRESFTISGEDGQVGEQVDGLIALDGQLILAEMKWRSKPDRPGGTRESSGAGL